MSCDIEETRKILSKYGQVNVLKETATIRIYIVDGVKIDFVHYSCYPWLDDIVEENGIRLASPRDISAMKINAIEGRGTRKDFVDIFFLLKHYTLSDLLDAYKKKYPEHSSFRALMSLSYYEDAEQQPMPKMFDSVSWDRIKKKISEEVKQYG